MHECPECYFVCDCDGDDLWNDKAEETCTCCEMGNASDAGTVCPTEEPSRPPEVMSGRLGGEGHGESRQAKGEVDEQ